MNKIKLFILIFGWLLLSAASADVRAQSLQGKAPSHVAVGEQFRLSYTIATHDVHDIRIGNVPAAFDVLVGPSTSSSSSFQMINGKTSSNESTTFTYILMANKAGTYTIAPAKATAKGKSVTSNSISITVSGKASGSSGATNPSATNSRTSIRGNDLFITVSASKRNVYEQEPVLLTYKVFTQVDLSAIDGKMPDLKGFHTQEVQLPQQKNFSVETYNGKQYRTVTWSQYVMYPQVTGDLTIPAINFTATVIVQNTNVDPFDAFFNGGMGYSEVNKTIKAPSVTIHVNPLPERPKNFSGGVGRYELSASLSSEHGRTGEPLKMRVVVSGTGNMKLIKQPTLSLPKDFDSYEPKIEDNTRLTTNGLEGNMAYEYLCVPRHKGKFTIPPVQFIYFDTASKSYKTLKSESFDVDIEKGEESAEYTEKEVLRLLNNDIRYIKTGDVSLRKQGDNFFLSAGFWLIIIVIILIFAVLLMVFRKRAIENANVAKMRGKKANKVASRKLKTAQKLMLQGRENEFYDEVLRTLWGYAGDKLNMPVESLSKDNITEKFIQRGIPESLLQRFNDALQACEFARYAPGDKQNNMQNIYDTSSDVISQIETTMKTTRKQNTSDVRNLVLLILCLLSFSAPSYSATKAEADSAYAREDYKQAAEIYEQIAKQGNDADIYYNLGNAYYREKNYPRAILNYERALILSPGDADIRFNLDLARYKTIDKIAPAGEMFFVTWYHAAINMQSTDGWAVTAIVILLVALSLLLLYMLSSRLLMRRIFFYSFILMMFLFLASFLFAWQQKQMGENHNTAIVMTPAVTVKSTPATNGTDLFVIHEGTKVNISDDSMKAWVKITLDDGKVGWIETTQIERI